MFSDILLTVDIDRTLTAPDGTIPQRNLDAIAYFMEHGGAFTVNTGRSLTTMKAVSVPIPHNAPLLLYNGSAMYEDGEFCQYYPIDLPMWQTVEEVARAFPELNVEIQTMESHYIIDPKPEYLAFYDAQGWEHRTAPSGTDLGPFIKFSVFGEIHDMKLSHMFSGTPEEMQRLLDLGKFIMDRWGDKVDVFYASPRILDVHAKGVSKLQAARDLQKRLGRKILVCAGDADNDIPMLAGADYGYCPSDAVVANRFPNVCSCADGAIADVIYKKIPEILRIQP